MQSQQTPSRQGVHCGARAYAHATAFQRQPSGPVKEPKYPPHGACCAALATSPPARWACASTSPTRSADGTTYDNVKPRNPQTFGELLGPGQIPDPERDATDDGRRRVNVTMATQGGTFAEGDPGLKPGLGRRCARAPLRARRRRAPAFKPGHGERGRRCGLGFRLPTRIEGASPPPPLRRAPARAEGAGRRGARTAVRRAPAGSAPG
jgi:hypothetical protein